jgi:hypothetical protein
MKSFFVTLAVLLLASSAVAGDRGAMSTSDQSLTVGKDFTTLFVTCGTVPHPECPRYLEPVGQSFLIHYLVLSGTSAESGSVAAIIKQTSLSGTEVITGLGRIMIAAGSDGSVVLTFPKPIRVGRDDVVGITCPVSATGCSAMATFGIELLR